MKESNEKQNKRTASADPLKVCLESTQEFFDSWMNSYQSTFGKLAQIPAFGPIREKQEKLMKGFPVYVNLYNTWVESNINFQTVFTAAMKKTYEKMIKETNGDITTTKYKDFYKIWLETYSETLKEFMRSGHFNADMGKLMSNFIDYQKYNKETIEENILKPSNLPTKSEIDEINKDLYALRKTLRELDKKTNEISKTINEKIELSKKIIDEKIELSRKIDELCKSVGELSKKTDDQKIDIQLELDKKIIQLDLDKKIAEISKRTDDQKIDIQLELDKKIIQLDLDKKIAEMSKKTDDQKIDIQSDIDKKIAEISKKTKADIQSDIDKKIAEISKKTKADIQLELGKKIIQLDIDKKIAEMSKKTKADIQLDIDKKIIDASKKIKTEIKTDLDNEISEISKKINESVDNSRST